MTIKPTYKVGDTVTYCGIPLTITDVTIIGRIKRRAPYVYYTVSSEYGDAKGIEEQDIDQVKYTPDQLARMSGRV